MRTIKYCKNCGKELTVEQRHNTYCSISCSNIDRGNQKIQQWLNGEIDGVTYGQISKVIRRYLLQRVGNKCELCGWHEVNPTTNLVPLEIHHIDGNYLNNSLDNLQVLCPNCHSLTPNYKSLNRDSDRERVTSRKNYCIDCGKEIGIDSLRCRECNSKARITEKPLTREELKEKIRTLPFTVIGKECGVSDNTIRKWCIGYNLPSKKKEIASYSDEEWEKI